MQVVRVSYLKRKNRTFKLITLAYNSNIMIVKDYEISHKKVESIQENTVFSTVS